jgi:NADPH:quinone reductase-like Zn-dependent oxidoreductase
MIAALATNYGGPDHIKIAELPVPTPKPDQLLIKVHSTTVSSADNRILRADPFVVRLVFGLFRPRRKIFGSSFAGTVENTGDQCSKFKGGDRVFGTRDVNFGTHCEFFVLSERALVCKMTDSLD